VLSREQATDLALLIGIVLLALFLRVYALDIVAWVPDSYDRLGDAGRLASGRLPQSTIYPPGVGVMMAPFFAVLPDSLWTMQAVIAGSGVVLVLVAYRWVDSLTGERLAALLAAGGVALSPPFVFASRDGLYDIPNVLLIAASMWLAGGMRRMPVWALILYGVMLAVLVNLRPNNVLVLPALALILVATDRVISVRDVVSILLSRPVLIVGATGTLCCVLFVVMGDWIGTSASAPITLGPAPENLVYYLYVSGFRAAGLLFLVPLALVGAVSLWRAKPRHTMAILYVIAIWPVLYAPFDFTSSRYMLPPMFLLLCLAAIGGASLLSRAQAPASRVRWPARYAGLAIVVLGLWFTAGSVLLVANWAETSARSDEGLAREFRPDLDDLPEGSLLVGAVSRAFHHTSPELDYFDLIDSTLTTGSSASGVDGMMSAIAEQLSEGGRVLYLHSHWEQGQDFHGDGQGQFVLYWEAITDHFDVTSVMESAGKRFTGETWTLYEVTARPGSSQ